MSAALPDNDLQCPVCTCRERIIAVYLVRKFHIRELHAHLLRLSVRRQRLLCDCTDLIHIFFNDLLTVCPVFRILQLQLHPLTDRIPHKQLAALVILAVTLCDHMETQHLIG